MVYDDNIGLWVDIYLLSGTGQNIRSAYKATITLNREYFAHVDELFDQKKLPLDYTQFTSVMRGSNFKAAIAGGRPSPATAGGHKDAKGRRMISYLGVEEGCGYVWQFLTNETTYSSYYGLDFRRVVAGGAHDTPADQIDRYARDGELKSGGKRQNVGCRGCSPSRFAQTIGSD